MTDITVALAGQPNAGKSTIFNMLTGARQHVANYPGITVEKKTGHFTWEEKMVSLIDLPGTYSLTSYSQEEKIARDYLLHEKPDVVLNIVDAANLERHLYLTLQLAEMKIPMVMVLNMMDVAKRHGFTIDSGKLGYVLGVPVIPAVGKKKKGGAEIKEAIMNACRHGQVRDDLNGEKHASPPSAHFAGKRSFCVDYGKELEPVVAALEETITLDQGLSARYPARWLAIKLLEKDREAGRLVRGMEETPA